MSLSVEEENREDLVSLQKLPAMHTVIPCDAGLPFGTADFDCGRNGFS